MLIGGVAISSPFFLPVRKIASWEKKSLISLFACFSLPLFSQISLQVPLLNPPLHSWERAPTTEGEKEGSEWVCKESKPQQLTLRNTESPSLHNVTDFTRTHKGSYLPATNIFIPMKETTWKRHAERKTSNRDAKREERVTRKMQIWWERHRVFFWVLNKLLNVSDSLSPSALCKVT